MGLRFSISAPKGQGDVSPGLRSLTLSGHGAIGVLEKLRSSAHPFTAHPFSYAHEAAVNVVAIAVRMVITTLRILPQSVLLLNVPMVLRLKVNG